MKKLAIVLTHPIQYYAPIFELLNGEGKLDLKVFYTFSQREKDFSDKDFGTNVQWDIPLLEGYTYTFVKNTASKPGLERYYGIQCPSLITEIEMWGATHVLFFGWNYHAHFKAMRHFKGKIPVLFRGDSTLLDYDIKSFKTLVSSIKTSPLTSQLSNIKSYTKYIIRKWVLSHIYHYVDKAFYVGTNNKAYFKAYGLQEQQLIFAPHAIDNQRFFDDEQKQYEQKATAWRKQLGINETDTVLLYAGKFEPRKNLLSFINTFKALNNTGLKLVLLGNGPLENSINENTVNCENIIRLPFQNQSNMPIVYRIADYYCLPSQSETWGLAVNEAMACGRPVIVSDKVGCAIDLINPTNGLVFEAGNQNDLLTKLTSLIDKKHHLIPEQIKETIFEWSFSKIVDGLYLELVKE